MTIVEGNLQLGALFAPTDAVKDLPEFVGRIDELGFDQLWFAEDCFEHGAFSAASYALAHMHHASVGIGLLPVALRNPAVMAMEIATLAELYPGRVRVAFGHGVELWMGQIGARPKDRVTYLSAVGDVVAKLLRGDEVTSTSPVVLDHVRLAQVPMAQPELLIGTTGQRGLEIAAALGFGLLMPEGAGVEAVRWARRTLPSVSPVILYCWLSVANDAKAAEQALLGEVRAWRNRGLYPRLHELAELPEAASITTQMLHDVAVLGTPADCARRLNELHLAGVNAVVFVPVGTDPMGQLARVQADVVPLLQKS